MSAWELRVQHIEPPVNPAVLTDIHPLLDRLVGAFGVRPLARLLDVEAGTIGNWQAGRRTISGDMSKRILELYDVLVRALRIFHPDTAMRWLVGNEPFLQGRRPIDVLVLQGAAPVIAALDGIESGAYA